MKRTELPMVGHCRCGAVSVEVCELPLLTAACHCRGCQVMSASAFSLTALIPSGGFRVISGTPVQGGLKGPELRHMFCPSCMSWMFTHITSFEAFINVRPSLFADLRGFTPFIETMTAEKLPWVQTPARHSYPGFPSWDQFEQAMEAYKAAF